jgi:hypothetical protein
MHGPKLASFVPRWLTIDKQELSIVMSPLAAETQGLFAGSKPNGLIGLGPGLAFRVIRGTSGEGRKVADG